MSLGLFAGQWGPLSGTRLCLGIPGERGITLATSKIWFLYYCAYVSMLASAAWMKGSWVMMCKVLMARVCIYESRYCPSHQQEGAKNIVMFCRCRCMGVYRGPGDGILLSS
jgi:hypothetical protein